MCWLIFLALILTITGGYFASKVLGHRFLSCLELHDPNSWIWDLSPTTNFWHTVAARSLIRLFTHNIPVCTGILPWVMLGNFVNTLRTLSSNVCNFVLSPCSIAPGTEGMRGLYRTSAKLLQYSFSHSDYTGGQSRLCGNLTTEGKLSAIGHILTKRAKLH